jgi:hypothetical protein
MSTALAMEVIVNAPIVARRATAELLIFFMLNSC